jgi:hypothetical protein
MIQTAFVTGSRFSARVTLIPSIPGMLMSSTRTPGTPTSEQRCEGQNVTVERPRVIRGGIVGNEVELGSSRAA